MGSQSRSAPRTVRQNLVSFVDHSRVKKFLQDPPACFDKIVIQRDIWMIQIDEISHALRHAAPHTFIFEDGFTAFFIELLDAVFFDILFSAHLQTLFHFDFDRKSVGIPSGLALDFIPLHRLIAAYRILECPGDHMMNTRLSVCGRRSLVKYKGRLSLPFRHTLFQKIFFLPPVSLFILNFTDRSVR